MNAILEVTLLGGWSDATRRVAADSLGVRPTTPACLWPGLKVVMLVIVGGLIRAAEETLQGKRVLLRLPKQTGIKD